MKIYKPREFAAKIGVSVRTLQRWDRADILPADRTITNRRFYTEEQLDECIDREFRLMNIVTFYDYTQRFIYRQSPTGDVARDIDMDWAFPRDAVDWKTIEQYLRGCGACLNCMVAAKRLYDSYKHYLRRLEVRENEQNNQS